MANAALKTASEHAFTTTYTPRGTKKEVTLPGVNAFSGDILGLPANDAAVKAPETDHQKVFRLINERRIEEAAHIAKRLIDAGDVDGFFIYGGTKDYRRADIMITDKVMMSRKGAFSEIVQITPEVAQRILKNNPNNRKIVKSGLVARLRDMIDGRYELNGQTIILSKHGDLNDGQHRLWSVLLSGVVIRTNVFFGAERDTRLTIDINKPREGATRLGFLAVPHYTLASAVVTLVHKIDNGRDATDTEKVEIYLDDANGGGLYQASIRAVGQQPKGAPKTAMASAAFILLRAGAPLGQVEKFFSETRTAGAGGKRSPSVALREGILRGTIKGPQDALLFTTASLYGEWRRGKKRVAVEIVTSLPDLVTF